MCSVCVGCVPVYVCKYCACNQGVYVCCVCVDCVCVSCVCEQFYHVFICAPVYLFIIFLIVSSFIFLYFKVQFYLRFNYSHSTYCTWLLHLSLSLISSPRYIGIL
jgi:hypothetical protein